MTEVIKRKGEKEAFDSEKIRKSVKKAFVDAGISITKTKDLIEEAISLPIEERALVADTILRSLNPPESELDKKWAEVAKRRLQSIRSGNVDVVPGDIVFNRIWEKYSL